MYKNKSFMALAIIIMAFGFSACGPKLTTLNHKVLAVSPVAVDTIWFGLYPNIEKIYKSDKELSLLCGLVGAESNPQWELTTSNGEVLQRSVHKNDVLHSVYQKIELSDDLKSRMKSGMYKLNLKLADMPAKTFDLEYIDKSIKNAKLKNILVFTIAPDISQSAALSSQWSQIRKSLTYGVRNQALRVADNVMVSGQKPKIKGLEDYDYLKKLDPAVANADVVITITMVLKKYNSETNSVTISVLNKTGAVKKFYYEQKGFKRRYFIIMCDLMDGVLTESGFLEYLANCNP